MVPPLWMMFPLLVARSLWLGGSGRTLCPGGWEWCLVSSRGKECVHPRPISEDRPLLAHCCWWELPLFPIFKQVPLYRCHHKKGTSSFSPETKRICYSNPIHTFLFDLAVNLLFNNTPLLYSSQIIFTFCTSSFYNFFILYRVEFYIEILKYQ